MSDVPAFRRLLLAWYRRHARALPWRETHDPYRIWVSEIMLQQTRVAAVLAHYRVFLERFPDIPALARAKEADVLAVWSGLGYYRRARMLHRAAQQVVRDHGGRLPRTLKALRALPGIGRYTAAAIASIAFGVPSAVVDGNVERVLSRLAGTPLRDAATWQRAQDLLHSTRPGDFNQAMMDLGATVCLPEKPLCGVCPVAASCATRGALPVAKPAARRKQQLAYALSLSRRNGSVRMVRRSPKETLMPGMWELPAGVPDGAAPVLRLRHSITTTDYAVAVYTQPRAQGKWIHTKKLNALPLTGLARKILKRARVF